ncbi:AAA family ATPase [Janibacter melonis]|uniref:AAA family ATPase n=1 Tax=Janibacter melonis TaxID=262209 RepID=UPI003558F2B1
MIPVNDIRPSAPTTSELEHLVEVGERLAATMSAVIEGKPEVVRTAITVMLAEGHLLVEDVPGVGKTMLAKTLARSVDASVRRVQFTPDLLPSDITGVSVFNQDNRVFEFRPGAVFANVVVGDEINRASPKAQSALLECMEEHQVTVDGQTHALPHPFMIMATQNPVEMEGTYPCPRRSATASWRGCPSATPTRAPRSRCSTTTAPPLLGDVRPVTDAEGSPSSSGSCAACTPPRPPAATSSTSPLRPAPTPPSGSAPRRGPPSTCCGRPGARALAGRDHVLPDDVQALAVPCSHTASSSRARRTSRGSPGRGRRGRHRPHAGARQALVMGSRLNRLTSRGAVVLGLGISLAAAGVLLGVPDLTRAGALLLVLPSSPGCSSRVPSGSSPRAPSTRRRSRRAPRLGPPRAA